VNVKPLAFSGIGVAVICCEAGVPPYTSETDFGETDMPVNPIISSLQPPGINNIQAAMMMFIFI
jgi:hypothetical protein